MSQTFFTVRRPGMLTTIQDLGRWGHQANGVPVAGPMDVFSHRLANLLLGNPDGAAALEITLLGPELDASGAVACAVAGAEFSITVDGAPAPRNAVFLVPAGARLRFGNRIAGARATLAVRGGVDVPAVLGSRATSLTSRMGPLGGRPISEGDRIPVGTAGGAAAVRTPRPLGLPAGGARLRVIEGPHGEMFTSGAIETFYTARYTITPNSNRMGYRLEGPPIAHRSSADILSDATPFGSIQVPKSGQPILLMADRQTTGGYPKIATVISADLPIAGQLAPGDWIEFAPCTPAAALEALKEQERRLPERAQ